jgi:putative FmdB family regulatory protein
MPLYPYTCMACGHSFETLVTTVRDNSDVDCPKCGSQKLEKMLGLPAKTNTTKELPLNCRGDGPPCGASWCGRK